MVYFDTPFTINFHGRQTLHSHMVADSLDELHAFAQKIGIRREWFQDDPRKPHYDLIGVRIEAARLQGAQQIVRRELWRKMQDMMAAEAVYTR